MSFGRTMEVNDLCRPNEDTYYFSYTAGIKQKVSNDRVQVEINQELKDFSNDVIGFDVQKVKRMDWQDIPKAESPETLFGKIATWVKQASDPVFTYCNLYLQYHKYDPPKAYQIDEKNKNWDALKWDTKRWHEDNDTLVARISQEFPRISYEYNKITSEKKPWGEKDPEQFNWEDNIRLAKFEKGRWFYSAIENSNHLDMCGWPALNIIKHIRLFFGFENRYQFSKNLFERLFALDFS